uniref:Uncharacterized protein n=1 Tax=Arundo donax TaxID=35708 RepID=A0A0A9H3F4_ARUDO
MRTRGVKAPSVNRLELLCFCLPNSISNKISKRFKFLIFMFCKMVVPILSDFTGK